VQLHCNKGQNAVADEAGCSKKMSHENAARRLSNMLLVKMRVVPLKMRVVPSQIPPRMYGWVQMDPVHALAALVWR
jgi:hypothetical protein